MIQWMKVIEEGTFYSDTIYDFVEGNISKRELDRYLKKHPLKDEVRKIRRLSAKDAKRLARKASKSEYCTVFCDQSEVNENK